jgi:hypothetical protein
MLSAWLAASVIANVLIANVLITDGLVSGFGGIFSGAYNPGILMVLCIPAIAEETGFGSTDDQICGIMCYTLVSLPLCRFLSPP